MTEPRRNRQVILVRHPDGRLRPDDFAVRESPVPVSGDGEFLVRINWLVIEPAQRLFVNDPAGGGLVAPGEVVFGDACGTVIETAHDGYAVGDVVTGWFGWQEYAVSNGRTNGLFEAGERLPASVALPDALALLSAGRTAYFGLLDVGDLRPGDTVLVSGAAGAVGSVAGQIARINGATVIGLTSTEEKCAWLREVAGFNDAIDYRHDDVSARLRELAPGGVDVYFDNVGGPLLDVALAHMARFGRIVSCGTMSSGYAGGGKPPGPVNISELAPRSVRIEGFVTPQFRDRFSEADDQMRRWVDDGLLVPAVDVLDGLDRAPEALQRLFDGGNTGKQVVRVSA